MFVIVLTCATVYTYCGLREEIRSTKFHTTVEECIQVAELALELAHLDKARFSIRCEKMEPAISDPRSR